MKSKKEREMEELMLMAAATNAAHEGKGGSKRVNLHSIQERLFADARLTEVQMNAMHAQVRP